jgi:5-methyltetrahydrofolate--homocysteine methyltransferase
METILKSATRTVKISADGPFVIVGEKINPTGRKKLAAAFEAGDFAYVEELARSQVAAGADVLDVNVGVPGLDDVALIKETVTRLLGWVDVPLCIDSPNPAVIETALSIVPGKPLVNSVSGEESRLSAILPVVAARGAAVIGLILDDHGIPATPEARLAVAEKILNRAVKLGIPAEDVIIDPLVMAIGADSQAGVTTLRTIALVHEKLGANMIMGASNVSHGMPERPVINAAFLALAIQAGATSAITDPAKLTLVARAADLLLGKDEYGMRYLKTYRKLQALLAQAEKA